MRFCLLPVSIYVLLACRHLALPGIFDDESLVGHFSLEIIRAVLSGKLLDVPTGIHPYHGILPSIASLPLIAVLPYLPVTALRLTFVVAGALTLVLFYRLAYQLIGRWQEALLAAGLLATSPSFVIGMRIGAYAGGLLLPIEVASLYWLSLWLESGDGAHLALSLFFLGLGLSCGAQFVFSFAATAGVLAYHLSSRGAPKLAPRTIAVGTGALLAGAAPIAIHVFVHFQNAAFFVRGRIAAEGSFFQLIHWPAQFERFRELVDGSAFPGLISGYRVGAELGPCNGIFPWIVGGALLLMGLSMFVRRRDRACPKTLQEGDLLAWQAIFFLASGTFRFAGLPIHIFAWLPLPQLCVAMAVARWRPFAPRWSRAFILAAIAVFGGNLYADAACMAGFDRYLVRTGGEDRFSSAVYDLVDWLKANPAERVLVLSRPVEYSLSFLSGRRIEATGLSFPTDAAPSPSRRTRDNFVGRRSVELVDYVHHWPNEDAPISVMFDEARALGYVCTVARRFNDSASTPVFTVWRCASKERITVR